MCGVKPSLFQYYQLQVTVPEERCPTVLKRLAEDAKPITKIHASLSFLLMARVHESKLEVVLDNLDKLGVGTEFGIVEVLPLAIAMPLYVVTETRKKKLEEEQAKAKASLEAKPKLESLFDAPGSINVPKTIISEDIFTQETNIRKSLMGAWESFKENCKPPVLASPRRRKENSKNSAHVKSPRRRNKRSATKEDKLHVPKPARVSSKSKEKGNDKDKEKKHSMRLKVTNWEEYLKVDEEDTGDRLLWGPKKSGHSKARSVDFGNEMFSIKSTRSYTLDNKLSTPCELMDTKLDTTIESTTDVKISDTSTKDKVPDGAILIDFGDNDGGVVFDIDTDDEDVAGNDDVDFTVEVVDKDAPTTKSDEILFSIDTDDEGDENVFTLEEDQDLGNDGDITFEIEEPKEKPKEETEFTIVTQDTEIDELEDDDTIDLVISAESSPIFVGNSYSVPVIKPVKSVARVQQETKIQRINSTTGEDRKPQIDSVATVQELFKIPEVKSESVDEPPKITKEKTSTSKSNSRRASSTIIAERFVVRDKDGNERAIFGVDTSNSVSITLKDSSSNRTISISIPSSSDNEMGMNFSINDKSRLSHHITDDNEVELVMYGPDCESYSKMKVQNSNSPEVSLGIKDQTLINLRGTQDISELNPSNALVSLRSDPGFSGLSICDTFGATRATLGWYDLKKLLRLEKDTDLVMIQMSGREASQDLDNFPEATLSVVGNVAKFFAKDKHGGIAEIPPRTKEDDVSVVVNIEKGGAQLGLVKDGTLRTLGPSKTQQLLNAYGFDL